MAARRATMRPTGGVPLAAALIANSRAIITSTGHDDCRLTRRDGRENEIFVGAQFQNDRD